MPVDPEVLAISTQAYLHSRSSIITFKASVHHSHGVMNTLPKEIITMISTWVRRYHYAQLAEAGWTQRFRCCQQKCKPNEHFDRGMIKKLAKLYHKNPSNFMQPSPGFEHEDPLDNWLTSNADWADVHKFHVYQIVETLREKMVQFRRGIEV